ncbi:inward rectifier potassium channel irk-1-like [Rhynchophorus ferrugineus]|uniref:inward rectifier potassium channel irk-1-like n=1 Tax=Rhynchophorus ferrugineus TaxID=354439 RepID=UPI003FCDC733
MPFEKDGLLQFTKDSDNDYTFPVILRTQHSVTSKSSKYDALRRNVSIRSSLYRKSDARLVSKRGRMRVYFKRIPHKSLKYARDLWNTLVTMQWRWLLFIVAIVNLTAYLGCTFLFYADSWISGDFDGNPEHHLCIEGAYRASNFFLLGIETITTTGYGYVHPTENCIMFYLVLTFSTLTSIFIDGIFISVVYAKMNSTKNQDSFGSIFSRKAVIAMRNGVLCLIVRINDRGGKHWIGSNICIYLVKEAKTLEGITIPHYVTELTIKPYGMLFWPLDVVHEINNKSPLWHMSAKDIMTTKLEILVVVSGSSVKTGQSSLSQTSYLNKEVMWGYQFAPCLEYNSTKQEYVVNKQCFNMTLPQEVPLCSAKVLDSLQKQIKNQRRSLDLSQRSIQNNELKNTLKYGEA